MSGRTQPEIEADIKTAEERALFHEEEAEKFREELQLSRGASVVAGLPASFWSEQLPACVQRAIGDKLGETEHYKTGEASVTVGPYTYTVVVESSGD